MARTEARAKTSIWKNQEFVALTNAQQRLYFLLITQPTISLCGVVAMTIEKWSYFASDSSREDIENDLSALDKARFIVVDRQTQEVLVRTFLKHDGVWNSPKTLAAALAQFENIDSARLRDAVTEQISKMQEMAPKYEDSGVDVDSWLKRHEYRDNPPHTLSPGASDTEAGGDSDTSRVRACADSVSSLQSPSPSPSSSPSPGASNGSDSPMTEAEFYAGLEQKKIPHTRGTVRPPSESSP